MNYKILMLIHKFSELYDILIVNYYLLYELYINCKLLYTQNYILHELYRILIVNYHK